MADVTIHGLAELDRALRELPEEIQGQPVRASLKAGATVVRDGARRRAPRDPNVQDPTLAEDIDFVVRISNKKNQAFAHIGPTTRTFYGGFQELGTSHHRSRPFLRPALDEDGMAAVAAFADVMKPAIEKAAKRYYRKVGLE